MIKLELALGVVVFALWVFCLADVLGTRDDKVRALPKLGWFVLVLLFPLVGSVLWLVAGRPRAAAPRSPHERAAPAYPEYDRPGRAAAATPEGDEEFLRRVRERAEEQRRRYDAERRDQQRAEQEAREERRRRKAEADDGPPPGEDPGAGEPSPGRAVDD